MEKNNSEIISQFKELLALHERTLKYIESNKSDELLIQNYKKLQSHLRNLSDNEIYSILSPKSKKTSSNSSLIANEFQDNEIEKFTIEQIEQEISKDKVSRKYLERIATVRFGMTKGSASSLPNKEALIEKIQSSINNEQTHLTIAKLASNNPDGA